MLARRLEEMVRYSQSHLYPDNRAMTMEDVLFASETTVGSFGANVELSICIRFPRGEAFCIVSKMVDGSTYIQIGHDGDQNFQVFGESDDPREWIIETLGKIGIRELQSTKFVEEIIH